MDNSGFNDLRQQAEQLTADIDRNGELPRVERNLQQLLEAGTQLWSRNVQAVNKDTSDIKASILLGSKGYDLPQISQRLEGLSTTKTFEPIEPLRETDIEGFLKNERENAILSVIEEAKKSTYERADRLYWESLENEWEREKHRIMNSLMGSSQEIMDIAIDVEEKLSSSTSMNVRTAMDNTELAYAREIYIYNEHCVQGGLQYDLAEKFYKLSKELDDKNVIDLWEMVKYMTEIPLKADIDILAARCSVELQNAFVQQARKYLEQKYLQYIQAIVYGNLYQAKLGGIPGTYSLVCSFLNIQLSSATQGLEDGLVEGHPAWAVIYYCIRCGDLKAALQAAKKAGLSQGDFISYLKEYMQSEDHRLSSNSELQIRLYYKRSVRTSTDPYKRAVYCVLGSCDITDDHSDVACKTDDYLWLKLCQIQAENLEDQSATQQDRITLSNLQILLLEFGEGHFNAYQQPFLYFQVLFLTAQFEAAIEFLCRIEALRCHAVHVAITLYEMNLLALAPSLHVPLISKSSADKPPMCRINFSRLIMMFTRKFEVTDPREALQYFYLLRKLKGIRGENLFMACVSELVLETKEFEMLLGKMEADGCRRPGLIDKFHGDTEKIIELVSSDSEKQGQYEDAVVLYDLAKNHEKVLKILNKLLTPVVPQVNVLGSTRNKLETLAVSTAQRYKTQGHTATRETSGTFYLLLDLMTFFNHYHSNNVIDALNTIQKLNLLPFEAEDVEPKVNLFTQYSEEVRRNIPDILLATMSLLFSEYKKAKSSVASPLTYLNPQTSFAEDGGKEKFLEYVRKKARALITFAGMIPYRMPGDTNARLVQMEVLMN